MAAPTAGEVARRLIILKYQVVQALAFGPVRSAFQRAPETQRREFHSMAQKKADDLAASFRKLGLWEFLTDKEVEFYSTNPLDLADGQMINASWRMESVMSLMLVLGIIPQLVPFDQQSRADLIKQIPQNDISIFFANAKLIDNKEIETKRSLAELWHWRSRTQQLIKKDYPFTSNVPGITSFDDVVRITAKTAHGKDALEIIGEDFAVQGKAYRDLDAAKWAQVSSIAFERHFAFNWVCGYAPNNGWDETPTDT